jgi:FtsH-binding integral membrane protein
MNRVLRFVFSLDFGLALCIGAGALLVRVLFDEVDRHQMPLLVIFMLGLVLVLAFSFRIRRRRQASRKSRRP